METLYVMYILWEDNDHPLHPQTLKPEQTKNTSQADQTETFQYFCLWFSPLCSDFFRGRQGHTAGKQSIDSAPFHLQPLSSHMLIDVDRNVAWKRWEPFHLSVCFSLLSFVASEGNRKQLQLPTQTCGCIFIFTSVHPYDTTVSQRWRQFTSIAKHGKWLHPLNCVALHCIYSVVNDMQCCV